MLPNRIPKNHALRVYTVALALVSGGAVTYAVDASAGSSRAVQGQASVRAELQRLQSQLAQTIAHDRTVTSENRHLVRRYDALVASTRAALRAAHARQVAARAATAAAAAPAPPVVVVASPPPSAAADPAPSTQTS